MARPSKLSQKITVVDEQGRKQEAPTSEVIVRALRVGAYVEDAAQSAGVAVATVYNWLARGEEHRDSNGKTPAREKPYVEFLEAVEKARADAVVANLALVRKAAQRGSWQAAAWWLERTRPDKFGRRDRHEVDVSGKTESKVTIEIPSTDEFERQVAEVYERLDMGHAGNGTAP